MLLHDQKKTIEVLNAIVNLREISGSNETNQKRDEVASMGRLFCRMGYLQPRTINYGA